MQTLCRRRAGTFVLAMVIILSSGQPSSAAEPLRTIGRVERLNVAFDSIISADAKVEVVCDGFQWCEGPVWVGERGFLLFSDIPRNSIVRWDERSGCSLYLKPAGYTGDSPRGGESGSNGLTLDRQGRLILCQHGDRRVARLDSTWDDPQPKYVTLADRYDGKRLNSPNDAIVDSHGAIYFTDPPYGLEKNVHDPTKELPYQGVYRISPDGELTLLTKDLERPNGIGLSPDERTLYVTNSHGPRPIIIAFALNEDGSLGEGREFFNARKLAATHEGACDGLTVDEKGNVFATVPGGVAVLSPDGKHLGSLLTGKQTSNCTFGENGDTLFITAGDFLLRVQLR